MAVCARPLDQPGVCAQSHVRFRLSFEPEGKTKADRNMKGPGQVPEKINGNWITFTDLLGSGLRVLVVHAR
jgi:hypothetical protein